MKGWVASLSHIYGGKLDVLNRGYSGYNTKCGKYILPQLLPKKPNPSVSPKIQLLVIFLGANDDAIPPNEQHVPIEKYKENLSFLINLVQSPTSDYYAPHTRVLIITPPALDDRAWEEHCNATVANPRKNQVAELYAKVCIEVAKEYQIPYLDTWTLFMNKAEELKNGLNDLLIDGLHLSADGNEFLFQAVSAKIIAEWPELDSEKMKPIFPLYDSPEFKTYFPE